MKGVNTNKTNFFKDGGVGGLVAIFDWSQIFHCADFSSEDELFV